MIEIKDKSMCCGCEACVNICPQNCITMKEDEEGFRYPQINKEKCINCGLCNKACPLQNEVKKSKFMTKYYAAYNKSDKILSKSSSGGMFWLLVKYILEKRGVIYGVIQDSTYNVKFTRAKTEKECISIRKSKYLQARVNDTYLKVKEDLKNNKYVLFSGTPCQVAALYKFLDKDYEKLYTVDVVCHGVPSMSVYRKYIKYIEKKYKKRVININWRDKIKGKWGPNHVTILFDDGSSVSTISLNNLFQRGFLYNIYLRPSCYKCIYAKIPRIGDLSLADFWGYDGNLKKKNKNKGISAVIVSSKKGEKAFEEIERIQIIIQFLKSI